MVDLFIIIICKILKLILNAKKGEERDLNFDIFYLLQLCITNVFFNLSITHIRYTF